MSFLDTTGLTYLWKKIKATFVPLTRTINSKALTTNITLTSTDVGALADDTDLFVVDLSPTTFTISTGTGGASGSHTYTKSGYKLAGLIGYSLSGTGVTQFNVYRMYCNSSGTVTFYVRAASSTTCTVTPKLLWIKSDACTIES